MATITVRKIDDEVKDQLKQLADQEGRSVEGYVRQMIYKEVKKTSVDQQTNLLDDIQNIMASAGAFLNEDDIFERNQETQRGVEL